MKKQIFQIEEAEQLKSEQLESTKSENMMIRSKLLELEEFLRDVEQERDRYRSYVTNRIWSQSIKNNFRENETLQRNSKKSFEKELSSQTEILELEKSQLLKNLESSRNELESARLKYQKQKEEINDLRKKINDYQSKSEEQFEKYQKLTEKSSAERGTLEKNTRVLEGALEQLKERVWQGTNHEFLWKIVQYYLLHNRDLEWNLTWNASLRFWEPYKDFAYQKDKFSYIPVAGGLDPNYKFKKKFLYRC